MEDPYFRLFFENIALRENCFNCERLEKSNADITLGDFWGVKNIPEINDTNEGISMVVVHTKIGEQWLEKIRDKSIVYKLNQESVSYAYRKRSYTIKNQRMTLKSLYEKKNILDLTISRKIRIKGKIYKIRAINQKRKMKFEG